MSDAKTDKPKSSAYVPKEKRYSVTWKHNRSHEQYIGATMVAFAPHGEQILPEALVNHPDFQRVADDFAVREV